MSRGDNIALPAWALNQHGHALVEQIIAERPDFRITRGTWVEGGGSVVYRGATAGKLRQMHSAWFDREYAAIDTQYHVSGVFDQEAANAIHRVEDANQLIERVLRETAEDEAVLDLTVQPLGDGAYRVAA